MATKPQQKQSRRELTEERILDAFEQILLDDGVRNLSANAVVVEADVGKPLLYKYFGGLSGLVRAWGVRRDPWPGHVRDAVVPEDEDLKDQIERDLMASAEHFAAHPVILEFLAEELCGSSQVSDAFNEVREGKRKEELGVMFREPRYTHPDNRRLVIILFAALVYLSLRRRRSPQFMGVDLSSDHGWDDVMAMIRGIIEDTKIASRQRAREEKT